MILAKSRLYVLMISCSICVKICVCDVDFSFGQYFLLIFLFLCYIVSYSLFFFTNILNYSPSVIYPKYFSFSCYSKFHSSFPNYILWIFHCLWYHSYPHFSDFRPIYLNLTMLGQRIYTLGHSLCMTNLKITNQP